MENTTCHRLFEAVSEWVSFILLWGDAPGTGKTHDACTVGIGERSLVVINGNPDISSVSLTGHYIRKGSDYQMALGAVSQAMQGGSRLVIDELGQCTEEVHALLRHVMQGEYLVRHVMQGEYLVRHVMQGEYLARITLTDGTVITPAPGFQVIATMNENPDTLPEPLRDRFDAVIRYDSLSDAALAALPERLREACVRTATLDAPQRVGYRKWSSFAKLSAKLGDETAAKIAFDERANDMLSALELSE